MPIIYSSNVLASKHYPSFRLADGGLAVYFQDVPALLASTIPRFGNNTLWCAGPHQYREVEISSEDYHVRTAGGVRLALNTRLTPEAFGAISGESSEDATEALNTCLATAKALGLPSVDLGNALFNIHGRLIVDSLRIRNPRCVTQVEAAGIRVTGDDSGIENFSIDYGDSLPQANVGNGAIRGTSRRYGVMCVSRASGTVIENCELHSPLGRAVRRSQRPHRQWG